MTPEQPTRKRKPQPKTTDDTTQLEVQFVKVETQLENLTSSHEELSRLIRENEKDRQADWETYLVAHKEVCNDIITNKNNIARIEITVNNLALKTEKSFEDFEKKVKNLPLMLKILGILGSIALTVFTAFIIEVLKGNIQVTHIVH